MRNKSKVWMGIGILAMLALAAAPAVAGPGPGQGQGQGPGPRPGCPHAPVDGDTVVSGTVLEVMELAGPGRGTGIHLKIQADGAVIETHLGPSFYLAEKGWTFAVNDYVRVTGWQRDAENLVAYTVERSGETLTLLDEDGIPAWAGRGRGRGHGKGPWGGACDGQGGGNGPGPGPGCCRPCPHDSGGSTI